MKHSQDSIRKYTPVMVKGVAYVIVTCIMFTAAGCGGRNTKAGGEISAKELQNMNKTGLPIVKDKITLKFVKKKPDLSKPTGEMKMMQELEQKTNVIIDWMDIAKGVFNEKKNLMLASNELPDAFFGDTLLDSDILSNASSFVPMEKLIDEYAPNLKKVFSAEPDSKRVSTAPDGHIYSLPQVKPYFPDTTSVGAINKKWLDRLGLPIPQTTEDLYNALKAFKDKDPNGNGRKDEIPLTFTTAGPAQGLSQPDVRILMGSFGVTDETTGEPYTKHLMVKDSKVLFSPIQDGYKQGVKYLNKLYSEGLIDQEAFTQTGKQYNVKLQSADDIVGVFFGWTIANGVGQERADKDFVQLLPLKGPEGQQLWNKLDNKRLGRNMFMITTENKHPEITMRWVDQCYEPEMSVQIFYGALGELTEKMPDGKIRVMDDDDNYADKRWANTPADSAPHAVLKDMEEKIIPPRQTLEKWKFNTALLPYTPKQVYPNVFFDNEEQDSIKGAMPDINTYVSENFTKWIMKGNIDGDWDNYKAQLKKMDLDNMMKMFQMEYDKYNAVAKK